MKIREIIKLSDSISTEVNVLRDFSYRNPEGNIHKIKGYLPNKSSRGIIKSIISSTPEFTDRKLHLIAASYGTGKSYLLLMLANILAKKDVSEMSSLMEKVHDKEEYYEDGLSSELHNYLESSDPFLVVIPEYGDMDFEHALLEGLKYALISNKIEYTPKTNFEEAIGVIKHWENSARQNYNDLKSLISDNTVEGFVDQLSKYEHGSYLQFKSFFKEIIGSAFSETHVSAFPVFADTAKEIRKLGYRGIAIIYDEFGEMLGKLINSSSSATGVSVQNFLEDVKDKKDNSNIVFISASHQDPQTIQASKERDLNKIIGRLEKHTLIVSESEGEEILGTIFIKESPGKLKEVFAHKLYKEHLASIIDFDLYPTQDPNWIETKVLKNLYPLHPLTSYILPRLSQEFAQNTRSMFNFLSPIETKEGALRFYIEAVDTIEGGKLNLFTPDRLLDFFLKNIREDKEGRTQALHDAYRDAIGKVIDLHHQSIMRNLFMLRVVNSAAIRPTKETLFWTMNWEESRRDEFYNLLHDLSGALEYLEFNPTDKTYQFPDYGTTPLSKVIEEELRKLDYIPLSQCLVIWKEIFPLGEVKVHDHNNKYGCNRTLRNKVVESPGDVKNSILKLSNYYSGQGEYHGSGFIFYLTGMSEDEIEDLVLSIEESEIVQKYIFFATPINTLVFEPLMKETLHFKAIENTSRRSDVLLNPARLKNIEDQQRRTIDNLKQNLKSLFEPHNWKWNHLSERNIDHSSKPKLNTWINGKVDLLFSETPKIIDEAIWFTLGNRGGKDRGRALDIILNSDKDRIPLRDDSSNAADKRIVRNFFAFTSLTQDKKRDKSIQYGEVIFPTEDSPLYSAWKHIESKFVSDSYVRLSEINTPLIRAPYGLSRNLIRFLLTSYIRYEQDRIVIVDSRKKQFQRIDLNLLDDLAKRPEDFLIRRMELSGPELRYLDKLNGLFGTSSDKTWLDLASKFITFYDEFSPMQKGIIRDSGNLKLQEFYKSIKDLAAEFSTSGADMERLSNDFFVDHLPSLLLDSEAAVLEDNDEVDRMVKLVYDYKIFPIEKMDERKMDVIQSLGDEVFGRQITTKPEIIDVILAWFKNLPVSKQSGIYSDSGVNRWIKNIKIPNGNDAFEIYLNKLPHKPFCEWEDFSYEKFTFISQFKEYKKTIEDYTKSPIEVIQSLASGIFENSPKDCESENKFDSMFRDWWHSQPGIKRREQYSSETNLVLSQIPINSSVKSRYLETVPQAWKDSGFLAEHIPDKWEEWSTYDTKKIAEKYLFCINEVNNWRPPIEDKHFYGTIANLLGYQDIDDVDTLYACSVEWAEALSDHTRNAYWKDEDELVAMFFDSLESRNEFEEVLSVKIPGAWMLPPRTDWDEKTLETYSRNFTQIIKKVQDYRRPIQEIIILLQGNKDDRNASVEAFSFNVLSSIRQSEAYKNRISSSMVVHPVGRILYSISTDNSSNNFAERAVSAVTKEIGINDDWHYWSDGDDSLFVKEFNSGLEYIVSWKFPEVELIRKAKEKLKEKILELQKDLTLNENQIRKVLNDLLDDK